MEKQGWKTTAIVFMILFFGFLGSGLWAIWEDNKLIEKTNICYYEICEEYVEAKLDGDLCSCYSQDVLGYTVLNKTEYMR